MKIVAFPNASGSRYWRLEDPFHYLNGLGHEAVVSNIGITEEQAQWADAYVLQSCVDRDGIALLYAYQQEHGKKLIVDCDDSLEISEDSPFKKEHEVSKAGQVIRRTMEVADLITTTTKTLAHELQAVNRNVEILPNYMDLVRWDLPKQQNTADTIRIGWAGSLTHLKDLELLVEPLHRICDEYPQVKLIFAGDTRVADLFPTLPIEIVLGVPFDAWPMRLHGLRLDIGLAPLLDTPFNRCKSNIKWLEYGIAKVPGIYSPTVYGVHGFDGQLGTIAGNPEQWYRAMKNYIDHPMLREDITDHVYAWIRSSYDLKKHISLWDKAYRRLFNH